MNDHIQTSELSRLHGRRLLIAEDEPIQQELLAQYLRKQGCHVYLASDGAEAIAQTRRLLPDLVLMDINMPHCDGLTACRILKTGCRTRSVDVMFLSGATTPDDRVHGLLAGAVDYIHKPFNFAEVGLRLALHLQEKPKPVVMPAGTVQGSPATLDDLIFEAASSYLLAQMDRTPKLEQVARAAGSNVSRLGQAFKQRVDMSVFEYLREARMRQACQLLKQTLMEIQSIAQELGFTSGANFTAAFKARFGLTPGQFRQAGVGSSEAS